MTMTANLSQTQDAAANFTQDSAPSNGTPGTVIVTSEVYLVLETIISAISGVPLHTTSKSWTTSLGSTTTVQPSQKSTNQIGFHTSMTSSAFLSSKTGEDWTLPSEHDRTSPQLVFGVLGALGGACIAGLLISYLLLWHRRRYAREVRAAQHDDHPYLQGIDANRAGELLENEEYGKFCKFYVLPIEQKLGAISQAHPDC